MALAASLLTFGFSVPAQASDEAFEPSPGASEPAAEGVGSEPTESTDDAVDRAGATPRIVVVRDGDAVSQVADAVTELGAEVERELVGVVDAVAAALTDEEAADLEKRADVRYIERDLTVSIATSPIRSDAGCSTTTMARMDDASSPPVNIGFTVNWFGTTYTQLMVDNNGGVSLRWWCRR